MMTHAEITEMKKKAQETAKNWLNRDDIVVIDTETTGLDDDAEIVEISILDIAGNVLFDSLVKPVNQIPEAVTKIHGISNEDVAHAPCFSEIVDRIKAILKDNLVLIYNASYDLRLLKQSSKIAGVDEKWVDDLDADCVMMLFSKFDGTTRYDGQLKWHKLTSASAYFNYFSENAHRAQADCLMTIAVIEGIEKGE